MCCAYEILCSALRFMNHIYFLMCIINESARLATCYFITVPRVLHILMHNCKHKSPNIRKNKYTNISFKLGLLQLRLKLFDDMEHVDSTPCGTNSL